MNHIAENNPVEGFLKYGLLTTASFGFFWAQEAHKGAKVCRLLFHCRNKRWLCGLSEAWFYALLQNGFWCQGKDKIQLRRLMLLYVRCKTDWESGLQSSWKGRFRWSAINFNLQIVFSVTQTQLWAVEGICGRWSLTSFFLLLSNFLPSTFGEHFDETLDWFGPSLRNTLGKSDELYENPEIISPTYAQVATQRASTSLLPLPRCCCRSETELGSDQPVFYGGAIFPVPHL